MSCITFGCSQKAENASNPFLTEFQTPYGTPDFNRIKPEHYEPAFLQGMEQQNKEIKAIVENPEAPTFENTIVALDNSGEILNRVSGVFFALAEADTNDELMALEAKIAPMLSEHSDNIYLNADLYKRVAALHDQEEAGTLKLTTEQHYLLDKYYKGFIRSGAGLDAANARKVMAQIAAMENRILVVATHDLEAENMRRFDRIYLMGEGKVVFSGTAEEVLASSQFQALEQG